MKLRADGRPRSHIKNTHLDGEAAGSTTLLPNGLGFYSGMMFWAEGTAESERLLVVPRVRRSRQIVTPRVARPHHRPHHPIGTARESENNVFAFKSRKTRVSLRCPDGPNLVEELLDIFSQSLGLLQRREVSALFFFFFF